MCPLYCVHCSSSASSGNNNTINYNRCLQIIDEGAEIGVSQISFSGGEPLCFSPIEGVIDRAAKKKMEISIYTSGNVPQFEKIIGNLGRLGLTKVIFSLYSKDALKHEAISRKPGSFSTTISSIGHAQKVGLETELHFVPLSSNFEELRSLAAFARDLGVSNISLLRFVPQGRGKEITSQKLDRNQNKLLKTITEQLREKGHRIRTGSPYNFLLLNDQPQCSAGIDRITILPDLRIYPCDAFKRIPAESLVGTDEYSRLDKHGLEDCWRRSRYLKLIRDYLTSPFPKECNSCSFIDSCLSGCLAQKIIANGNVEKCADPDCLISLEKD